jgi:hypothetical protein
LGRWTWPCCSWRASSASKEAAAAREEWLASNCGRRRASGESEEWLGCWETRHCSVVARVGVQRRARLRRAVAADSTAGHAAVAMPRRPWWVQCVALQCLDGLHWRRWSRNWCRMGVGGERTCFSSRGLQMLQAARWQIGSGYGAVRTCKSSNWIGSASRMRLGGSFRLPWPFAHAKRSDVVRLDAPSHAL